MYAKPQYMTISLQKLKTQYKNYKYMSIINDIGLRSIFLQYFAFNKLKMNLTLFITSWRYYRF